MTAWFKKSITFILYFLQCEMVDKENTTLSCHIQHALTNSSVNMYFVDMCHTQTQAIFPCLKFSLLLNFVVNVEKMCNITPEPTVSSLSLKICYN